MRARGAVRDSGARRQTPRAKLTHEILHGALGCLVDVLHVVEDLKGEAVGHGDAQIVVGPVLWARQVRRWRAWQQAALTEYEFWSLWLLPVASTFGEYILLYIVLAWQVSIMKKSSW